MQNSKSVNMTKKMLIQPALKAGFHNMHTTHALQSTVCNTSNKKIPQ